MLRRLFLATLVCTMLFGISCVGGNSNTNLMLVIKAKWSNNQ